MKTITVTIDLYTYDELDETSQNTAINDLINAWMDVPDLVPEEARKEYDRACNDAEAMQTPWFCGEYIWDYCKEWVLNVAKEVYYTEDGKYHSWIEE